MQRKFLLIAALMGALAVILGAFAAHQLKQTVTAEVLQIFETAVRYQMYHVFALLSVGVLYQYFPGKILIWAGYLFVAGILLFSGSLYLLCYVKHQSMTDSLWIGAITPLGGLCFIAGWLLMAFGVSKK